MPLPMLSSGMEVSEGGNKRVPVVRINYSGAVVLEVRIGQNKFRGALVVGMHGM